jgi:tRNA-splicing ligase RtcB
MTVIEIPSKGVPIKAWVDGVPLEEEAKQQLQNIAALPVVWPHVAVMPDVHLGKGATVGSVVPTRGAIIPAAVGVDIGCGMMAVKLNLKANDLPDNLSQLREEIEKCIPHGRTNNGGFGDKGAWNNDPPQIVADTWNEMNPRYRELVDRHPWMLAYNTFNHLGTLGTGNHFVEVCLDTDGSVWIMLHSGSRGVGNKIGSYFIELAKKDMLAAHGNLPEDQDLAYLAEGTQHFHDYVDSVGWAQEYARKNREIMMNRALYAVGRALKKTVWAIEQAVNCHHNYVELEEHYGELLYVTRKGAVNAEVGKLGIIPGSMGAKSFIVRGKGNKESLCSCSHGAGRKMSRGAAKRTFTLKDHEEATAGVECRKDEGVIDETPGAYKSIDDVMAAQSDLVEVVATLKQVLCVKG